MNLLKETMSVLKEHGKKLNDVQWFGCSEFVISKDNFLACADEDYDSGFGGQEVATDLLVVGNKWWLERHEYDGAEWWEYKELPIKPNEERVVKRVMFGCWETLGEINAEDKE